MRLSPEGAAPIGYCDPVQIVGHYCQEDMFITLIDLDAPCAVRYLTCRGRVISPDRLVA